MIILVPRQSAGRQILQDHPVVGAEVLANATRLSGLPAEEGRLPHGPGARHLHGDRIGSSASLVRRRGKAHRRRAVRGIGSGHVSIRRHRLLAGPVTSYTSIRFRKRARPRPRRKMARRHRLVLIPRALPPARPLNADPFTRPASAFNLDDPGITIHPCKPSTKPLAVATGC